MFTNKTLEENYEETKEKYLKLKNEYKDQEILLESFQKTAEHVNSYSIQYNKIVEENQQVCEEKLRIVECNHGLNLKIEGLLKEIEEIKRVCKELTEEINKKELNQALITEKLEVYQKKFKELETTITELTKSNEDLKKLNISSQKLQEDQQSCLNHLKSEFSRYKQDKETKLFEAQKEIKYLEQEIHKDSKIEDLETFLKSTQEELKKTKLALDSFQDLNYSLTQKNAEISNSLGKMHSSHVPIYIVDQLRNELSSLSEEITTLKEENRKKSELLKSTKKAAESTKNDILV